ncbi:MAG: substrate-binding domain-containing protein [Bacillota bacterium]
MKHLKLFLGALLVISIVWNAQAFLESKKDLVLATTTSTVDSGLLNYLLPVYEKERGIKVKVLSLGTGQAIKTGEMGDCDVLLVHARAAEDKFVAAGFGINRRDVMHNDFIFVGPAGDPAGIKGLAVLKAMENLVQGKAKFISRGDNSGTYQREMELWEKAGIKPAGPWYLSVGKGMGDTLVMANELQAYTLTDRGTFASMKERLKLQILVEGDPMLLNPYGVIAVNPAKYPEVNYKEAMAFIGFLTSAKGRKLINSYKVNGEQLFQAD